MNRRLPHRGLGSLSSGPADACHRSSGYLLSATAPMHPTRRHFAKTRGMPSWSGRFHLEVSHAGQADSHHDRERAVLKPHRPCLSEANGQSCRPIELVIGS